MDMLESEQITFKTDEMDISDVEANDDQAGYDSNKQQTISDVDSHPSDKSNCMSDKEDISLINVKNEMSYNDQLINVETLSELSFHEDGSASQYDEDILTYNQSGLSHSFKELHKKSQLKRKGSHCATQNPLKSYHIGNEYNSIKHIDNKVETLSELSFHEYQVNNDNDAFIVNNTDDNTPYQQNIKNDRFNNHKNSPTK